ncbi:nucleotidyltransferase domain-containing protein [Stygiolobus caldivivus]|uniref:DNA polymerase subunit beta n=1 Tax=Stygiolobus caldivivus TaxID=2824673 RepID=A0A8D5U6B2_9CREN|nr:nucleotidyltransferase domain-containing protein [Stygiolobus caldivivus]BCU69875.1 DNA polymerase subunit beta [Stygiolobus caldivivus]
MSIVDILEDNMRARQKYLKDVDNYLKKIKEVATSIDPHARVILFGSYVRGDFRPDSDIDVLVITDVKDEWDRLKVYHEVNKAIGNPNPFEVHVVNEKEYKEWYSKFIDVYREV